MNLPELSIRLEVLPGETVVEQITNASRFGFDAIALPGRFKERWETPLRECLRDLALPLASISLGFERSLLSPSEVDRSRCRESLIRLFDLCAELQVLRFNMPPCLNQDNPERLTDAGNHPSLAARLDALLLEELPAMADAAEERGVTLLLEPVNKYESDHLHSIEHAARITREISHSHLACTADFFHMQLEELDTPKALARSIDQIGHVHLAENTRVEPGPGSMDFSGFGELKKVDYRGILEVECRWLSGAAHEVLPQSVDFVRRQWSAAEATAASIPSAMK